MIYMLTAWYPYSKMVDVSKLMIKLPKMPDYIKRWHVFGTADGKRGLKVYNLIMTKDGTPDEAAIFLAKIQKKFTDEIEGYAWKVETLLGVKDSMKVMQD